MQKGKSPNQGALAGGGVLHSKATATHAQRARILALLAVRPHNTEELRQAGVYQVATRIRELRDMGYDIQTSVRISLWDRDGFLHPRVAVYTLTGGHHG